MSKDSKLGNLLKFAEYDHLQPKQTPTKYTEVGGFAVLEGLSVKKLLKLAAKNSGKSKDDLKDLSIKDLKKLAKGEEKEEKKNESLVLEASEKQLAARKKFMEMIAKKKGESGEKEDKKEDKKDKKEVKWQTPPKDGVTPTKLGTKKIEKKDDEKKNESLVLEASAKQKAARAKFMEMIASKKKGKKEDKDGEEPSHKHFKSFKKKDKKCKDGKHCD
jgi:hypothetical protein